MILGSTFLITMIDLMVIFYCAIAAYQIQQHSMNSSKLQPGIYLAWIGLLAISLFYLSDLFAMWVLPEIYGAKAAMSVVESLHLNVNFIVVPIAIFVVILGMLRFSKALSEQELMYRTLSENSQDNIIRYDRNHRHLYGNRTVLLTINQLQGRSGRSKLSITDFIGKTDREIGLPDEFCDVWEVLIDKVFETGETRHRIFELENAEANIVLSWSLVPEYDLDGLIVSALAISHDVTKNQQALNALKASDERYQLAEKAVNDGLWDWNIVTHEQYLSPRWKEIVGYADDELPNQESTVHGLIHPDDKEKIDRAFRQHVEDKDRYEVEYRLLHKDGRYRSVISRGEVVRDDRGRAVRMAGSISDITQSKLAVETMLKLQKLESIGTLAGGIAHDFNNILTAMFGNISLAKLELPGNHPGFRFLERTESAMHRATRLTNQLLTFSKGGEPVRQEVCFSDLVQDVVQLDLSSSNLKPVFSLFKKDLFVSGDKHQLRQVISNLVRNAKEAMPDGGNLYVSIKVIDVQAGASVDLRQGRYIKLTIVDEGTGIEKVHINRVFEPYFSTRQGGAGLGLAISHSIVSKHSGEIRVESESGKGTRFTIFLPFIESETTQVTSPEVDHSETQKTTRILVMDDEKMIREFAAIILSRKGFEVETAEEGEQATRMYEQSQQAGRAYDCVILDLTIPDGLGGKETVARILEIDQHARVIVSSGYADDPVVANYNAYGFKGILTKPYSKDALYDVICETLVDCGKQEALSSQQA